MPVAAGKRKTLTAGLETPETRLLKFEQKKLVRITTVPQSLRILLKNQLNFMSSHFHVLAISSPGNELEEFGKEEGIETAAIRMTRAITPIKDLKAAWKIYAFLKKAKPDIVHTHTPKAGLLGMLVARMAGVPVRMHTIAGLPLIEARGIKRKLLELTEKITCSCATKVYSNSFQLSGFIQSHQLCPTSKLKVLGNGSSNGINTNYFKLTPLISARAGKLRKIMGVASQDFIYIFIGRLVKDKGIEELVDAFLLLNQSYSAITLLLVGPFEPERDPVSDRIQNIIRTNPAIIHTGFQQDIRPFLALSHVLVFPSYREGFPNVPMQAGCFHLPTIATDINGCNEIIKHGVNGMLVPPKQVDPLMTAMKIMIDNKPLYQQFRKNARSMITSRFEQTEFWKLLLQEYHHQLNIHSLVSKIL